MSRTITQINASTKSCNPVVRDNLVRQLTEKGILRGTISKKIARQLYPKARPGQLMTVGPATLTVVE